MRRGRERGGAGRGQMEGRETERRAFAFRLISTTPASIGDRERQRERRVRGASHNRRQNAPPQPSPAERGRSALPAAAPPRVLSVCCPERRPVAAEVGTAA